MYLAYPVDLLLPVKYKLLLLPFYHFLDRVQDYPGEPVPEGKTILDLLKQEIVSGSGINWAYANLHLAQDR